MSTMIQLVVCLCTYMAFNIFSCLIIFSFFSMLEQSHWLDYISQLLRVTNEVVEAIAVKRQPVLVHCSDGWDRTTQVVALAELLLDPYYRTIEVGVGDEYT